MNEFKKPNITNLFLAVLGIIFLFFIAKTISSFKEIKFVGTNVPAMNVLTVTGEGEIITKPDTATFTFTVTKDAVTMKEAEEMVSTSVASVVDGAKEIGVAEEDIKTVSYSTYPKYKYDGYNCYGCERLANEIVGYTVSEQVEIKIRNLENVATLATLMSESKVTNVYGPEFSIYDEDGVRDSARSLAIMDAKEQAEKLADDLGVKLGRIVSFSDEYGYPYSYANDYGSFDTAESKSTIVPTIQTGTNTITENVTITYEIR